MGTRFRNFHRAYPPDEGHEPYDPARHDAFADRVPIEILNEWRKFGFGSYGNGIIWTVSPDEQFLNPDDWHDLDGTGIEVLRTALGDVGICQGGKFIWISILTGQTIVTSTKILLIFRLLATPRRRKRMLFDRFFSITRKRLGPLTKDECYGYVKLPALGGAVKEKYLIKTPLREYASMSAAALRTLSITDNVILMFTVGSAM
jgi:hypothetical protein